MKPKNAFEKLLDKQLSEEQVSEIKFNLADYIEALAQFDKQHKEHLNKQNNRGSKNSE